MVTSEEGIEKMNAYAVLSNEDIKQELALWELEGMTESRDAALKHLRARSLAHRTSLDQSVFALDEDTVRITTRGDLLPNRIADIDTTDELVLQSLQMWLRDSTLTPKQAEAIYRCIVEEWRYIDVATLYSVSESTVRDHLQSGLAALRQRYESPVLIHTCAECHVQYACGGNWWEQASKRCPLCGSMQGVARLRGLDT